MEKRPEEYYTYRVLWSEEDREFVGLCAEFPSLSWLAAGQAEALSGIVAAVGEVLGEMRESGEKAPEPLALKEYSGKFMVRVPNAIDFRSLSSLSEDDLKELGLKLGHRRVLQRAILDRARAETQREIDIDGDGSTRTPSTSFPERRHITIMFCDLAGSTAISQRLELEDFREINTAFQDACKAAIERYDGYVARYMGDGVLAYFGYPVAHEDDAERAIHAGLRVINDISTLGEKTRDFPIGELGVRVGISSGQVVAGDHIGEGSSQESTVVGDAPNLAARLQGLASANSVYIAPTTRELVKGRFELTDVGEQSIKGFDKPVRAWRVLAPLGSEIRFDATRGAILKPLVGREKEFGLLLDRWEQANRGEGQVVLLSGEAGIGKSRLIESLRDRLANSRTACMRYQCSPFHCNSALYPVVEKLGRAAQLEAAGSDEAKLAQLESLLDQVEFSADEATQLLAHLLSISTAGRYAPLQMTPERQRQETLLALVRLMEAMARSRPLLLIYEDVHWADPTTLALLELVMEWAQEHRALAIISHRLEFDPPWSKHLHVTSLTLNRLARDAAAVMVAHIAGRNSLPEPVCQRIVERADGVPLFVEELTANMLESANRDVVQDTGVHLREPSNDVIPATLHDSLTARLDRLSTGKKVAQAGAAIGREFSLRLLSEVCGLSDRSLESAVDGLLTAGLAFRRGLGPEARLVFKHALVQEAAYASLLRDERRTCISPSPRRS